MHTTERTEKRAVKGQKERQTDNQILLSFQMYTIVLKATPLYLFKPNPYLENPFYYLLYTA